MEFKRRVRHVGNITFVGELYKVDMLTTKIIHMVISDLLEINNEEIPETQSIELSCKLITTIGPQLDIANRQYGDMYFAKMRFMSQDTVSLDSRLRYMLKDLIELRDRNWVSRKNAPVLKTSGENNSRNQKESILKSSGENHLSSRSQKEAILRTSGDGHSPKRKKEPILKTSGDSHSPKRKKEPILKTSGEHNFTSRNQKESILKTSGENNLTSRSQKESILRTSGEGHSPKRKKEKILKTSGEGHSPKRKKRNNS